MKASYHQPKVISELPKRHPLECQNIQLKLTSTNARSIKPNYYRVHSTAEKLESSIQASVSTIEKEITYE